jgi:RNA polymerase sigma factor (sigma-70 family)
MSADDLMQQTYTDAFLSISRFQPRGERSLASWLISIAQRNLQDAIRMLEADKRGGDTPAGGESAGSLDGLLTRIEGPATTPSRDAARAEAVAHLRLAIDSLPGDHRQIVRMHDLEGRPMQEVAKAVGRTLGSAYMLRARAMAWLREAFGSASFPLSDSV